MLKNKINNIIKDQIKRNKYLKTEIKKIIFKNFTPATEQDLVLILLS